MIDDVEFSSHFFFFQAEDGIRDYKVTGVQTCALPISPVITRLGAGEAKNQKWPLSTDNKATFYPGDAAAFLEQLLAANRFVAQTTPYSESPITAVFDVAGLSAAVKPLREVCPAKGQ